MEALDHAFEEGFCTVCGEEDPDYKEELSGETRIIYFHNAEGWEEVYAAWSFDEEDFEDVEFPGEKMKDETELEDVWFVELPVEADDVLFSDGIEVTEELLAAEKEAGLEVIHEIAAELETKLSKDLYQNEEWTNYEDEVDALEEEEETEPPVIETEPPVMDKAPETTTDPVQELIDSLPASVNSQEEYDAVYAVVQEIEDNGYDLTGEQMDAVFAAMNAADEWFGAPEAGMYAGEGWYFENGILYIKNGTITKASLYAAFTENDGKDNGALSGGSGSFLNPKWTGCYKYQDSAPVGNTWIGQGTELRKTDSGSVTLTDGTMYYGHKTGYTASWSDVRSFPVKAYYTSSVTVTGKDGVTATITAPTDGKVIHGNTVTFTLPAMGETGWFAQIGSSTPVALNADAITTLTTAAITSAADAAVKVSLKKEAAYAITKEVVEGKGTVTVDYDEAFANTTVTVTVAPAESESGASYTLNKVTVNGTEYTDSTFTFTMPAEAVEVKAYFNAYTLEANESPVAYVSFKDNDTKADGLKTKVLDAAFGAGEYNESDYDVFLKTSINIEGRDFLDRYWNVTGDSVNIFVDIPVSASTIALSLQADKTADFQIRKKATESEPQVYLNVDVLMKDSRSSLSVEKADDYTFESKTPVDASAIEAKINELKVKATNPVDGTVTDVTADATVEYTIAEWPANGQTATFDVKVTLENDDIYSNKANKTFTVTLKDTTILKTVIYTDGVADKEVFADQTIGYTEDDEIPAFVGDYDCREFYTFAGWSDEVVENTTTYTATWTPVKDADGDGVADEEDTFIITWVNGDETKTTEVPYGEMPVPYADAYKSPVNDANGVQKWSYNCAWPALAEVTADVTYTATCTVVPTEYTITWNVGDGKWADGTTEAKTTSVAYGEIPVAPATPAPNAENHYFAGWVASEEMTVAEELPAVTGAASYTATYSADTFYNVTFLVNGEQYGNIQTVNVTDGEKATAPEAPVVRYFVFKYWSATENGAEYEFASEVTGDLTLHAVFDEAVAEVGTKGYTTWAKAYAAANSGDTITLLSDIPCYGELRIEKSITVDGNGFKFVADPSYTGWKDTSGKVAKYVKYAVAIAADNVTLKNVTVDCAKLGKGLDILAYDNIVLDNVTVKNEMGNAININGSEVIFRNTIDAHVNGGGTNYSVKADEGAIFTGRFVFQGTCDYANTDMDLAMATDGTNYFSVKTLDANGNLKGYDTKLPSSFSNGYTYKLLEDMTQNSNATLAWKDSISSATLDLNGKTLTIADGKIIAVQGNLFIKNEGSVVGNIDLAATEIGVYGSADLPVRKNAGVPADYTVVYKDGKHSLYLPLPDVVITPIKNTLTDENPDLTFALNFGIKDLESLTEDYLELLMEEYGDWYVDYVLTIEGLNQESVTFNADGNVDGYLAGQYDAFGPDWLTVPFENVTVKNGESFYIMETAAKLMSQSGLRFTLEEIATIVVNFDCGVYFTPEFLQANPDMKVTLELKVFAEEEKQGKDEEIIVATNEFKNDIVAIIAAEGKQTHYFSSLEAAAANKDVTITLLKDVVSATIQNSVTIDPNGQNIGNLILGAEGIAITAPENLNVTSGVEGLDVIYADGKYSLANDINHNNVPDGEETITIAVTKANDADAVTVEATDAEAKAPVEKALSTADGTKSYVFDSTKPGIKITATPVVAMVDIDGAQKAVSTTYVTSINGAVPSYDEKFTATSEEITATNGAVIEVNFAEAKFTYDEDGKMRFYVGMEDPNYETLYNAVILDPAYDATEGVVSAKYLARPSAKYQMQVPVLFEYTIPIINYEIKIGGNTVDLDLDDAWLDVGESFKTLTPEELQKQYDTEIQKIKDKIAAIDLTDISWSNAWGKVQEFATISDELNTLINTISNEAKYLGYHQFGASDLKDENGNVQEKLQVIYQTNALRLWNEELLVTLEDDRTPTTITAGNLTFEYDEFTDEDIMNAMVLTDVDGNVIEGNLTKHVDLVGTEVGERTFSVYYEGSWDYKPATAEFTLTVIKAPSSVEVLDQNITYPAKVSGPVITNKHGKEIDIDAIEFILGLDVADLDIDGDGVKGLEGRMQLILTEELQTILSMVGLEEGVELNINDLISMLTNTGLLDQWGVSSEMVDTLNQILNAINGVVEANDLLITIGGEYPSDVGAYLHGAVTVDKNYETSYDVGYILIKPQATEYKLEWNNSALTNAVVTLPMFNDMDKGAHVVEAGAENLKASYVILGVNDDKSEILSTDIYGNIKANIWLNADDIKSNGAYLQIAYGLNWGNEFDYAMPIVRAFAVVPALYDVQLVGATGTPNNELLKDFNNEPQGFSVIVKNDNGEIIFSDHYQNVTELKDNAQLIVNYTGVQTNGKSVNLTTVLTKDNKNEPIAKPVHAGVYAATVFYAEFNSSDFEKLDVENLNVEDLYKLFDLADAGMDAALLVIEPTESNVTVEDKIVKYNGTDIFFKNMVTTGSTVEGLKPDATIITAGIDTDAAFSENGWDAIRGIVNVDFPAWMDELLDQYAPEVKAGMSVAELKDVLLNKLPDITAKLVELGATDEMVNSLTNLTGNVADVLAEIPDNVKLSFIDDAKANEIGAYIVTAVVTDSDHYPSVDAGYLVVVPDVEQVELKWNYEDENNIFTRDLLQHVDLLAKAYDAKTGAYDETATGKISYKFVGIDSNNEFKHYSNPATLPNGAYIQMAYIELDIEGEMVISDMIARPIVVIASNCNVNVENVETVFDNARHGVNVTVTDLEGNSIEGGEFTILYAGLQTNGKAYLDTDAPVHAGVYEALVTYTKTVDGELRYYGANVGYVLIDLAESEIAVTGDTVTYDGNGHTAQVEITKGHPNADYTLISGGAYVSGDINEVGLEALHGNVNIDLPRWLDEALAEYEFTDGVNAAKLADYIEAYRDELVAAVKDTKLVDWNIVTEEQVNAAVEKLNAYIDELVAVLKKLPTDVALTFVDDITYAEPGAYFYYGIVTDSDHYPSTDTGLLVIEKKDMVYDLLNTTYTWDGEGKMVEINNPNNADALTLIIDRKNNTANFLIDNDAQYLLNTVARILGVDFDGDVQMSTILEKYSGEEVAAAIVKLITEAEKLDLPEESAKALAAVKKQLQNLPADGTIVLNGDLPSEIGTYEVYAVSYSQYYKTNASEAVLKIVPIQVEVELENQSKIYGSTDPELTYVIKFYDHKGNEVAGSEDAVVVTIDREDGENVGTYVISATAEIVDEHYTLIAQPENAVFEITPAEIISAETPDVYYNGETHTPVFSVIASNGETEMTVPAEGFTITGQTSGKNAGNYTVTVTGKGNYTGAVEYTWSIMSAEVKVTIDDASKVYGDNDPAEFVHSVEFVNGFVPETELGLTVKRESGEFVGTYGIHADWNGSANYGVDYEPATFTITKAAAHVDVQDATKVYGEDDPAFSAKVTGLKFEDEFAFNFERTEGVNVGEYEIRALLAEDDVTANYDITYTTGTLTIKPAEITDFTAVETTYNGQKQTAVLNVTGVNGEVLADTVGYKILSGNEQTNAGTYTVTIVGVGNYTGEYTAEWVINPAEITSVEVVGEYTYNGTEQTATLVVKAGDLVLTADDYTVTGNTGMKEGAYKATVTGTGNYTGTADADWKILPAMITSVEVVGEYTYNGAEQTVELLVKAGDMIVNAGDYKVTGNTATDAGENTVIVSGIGSFAGVMDAKWTITKAEITVTVDDVTIAVDDKIPAQDAVDSAPKLTYTVTVGNATVTGADLEALIAKLSNELKVEITATVEQNDAQQNIPGTYENDVKYVESDNYVVTVVKGNVIVKLGDYICWNMQTGVYYNDVSDGLMATTAGQTLQMLKDATDAVNDKDELVVIVNAGTTFDLNGYYVETANLLSYGVVLDTVDSTDSVISDGDIASGGILISNDTTKAWTMLQPTNGGYLPIYDTNTGSYKFYEGTDGCAIDAHDTKGSNATQVKFRFRLLFNNLEAYQIIANSSNTGFDVVLEMAWTGITNFDITYTMADQTVKDHGSLQYSSNKGKVMTLTAFGAEKLSGGYVDCVPTVVSQTGVNLVASETLHYDIP